MGWTIFSRLMGNNYEFKEAVIAAANSAFPGLLVSSSEPNGLVDPDSLIASPNGTLTGWIALFLTIVTASAVISSLSQAIRAMFGIAGLPEKPLIMVARRFLGLFTLLISILCTALLTSINTFLHSWVTGLTEYSQGADLVFNIVSVLITFIVDLCVFMILVRLVAGARPPKRDLFGGALLYGIGSSVLRLVGTSIVSNSVAGPVLTTATTLITLILWINLLASTALFACAWTANPPSPEPKETILFKHSRDTPNYVTLSVPDTLQWEAKTDSGSNSGSNEV